MILSKDAEKAFEKTEHPFLIKTLNKVRVDGTHLNIIKAIYERSKASIILKVEKLGAFSFQSQTK